MMKKHLSTLVLALAFSGSLMAVLSMAVDKSDGAPPKQDGGGPGGPAVGRPGGGGGPGGAGGPGGVRPSGPGTSNSNDQRPANRSSN